MAKNSGVTTELKGFVADTYALLAKTQACHWNAKGPNFIGLHKLTEAQYEELFHAVDELAERLRALDAPAPRGLAEMLELASLKDAPASLSTEAAAKLLAEDNSGLADKAKTIAEAADEAGDLATHDMLVARIDAHQKAAWLLRSHVV
ncbi:DNA starvation/stationary phase protection protein [Rhodovarius crocodyli]|uniref:DNA starvation/stationary phase protection protein n=1 Tax=Rhodovarius crocodyli TaxID=1979269 RepID=A0A437M2D7_9PROT|nr:DNA starvation/stationary phase protection protein [Rhodovarius crocodyli]RVT91848.1 DNA starvation/stationary phase protection protein [Rhodovarius crocodyli]